MNSETGYQSNGDNKSLLRFSIVFIIHSVLVVYMEYIDIYCYEV